VSAALDDLMRADWRLGANAVADQLLPTAAPDARRAFARLLREAASADTTVRLREATAEHDLGHLLAHIRAPTLVLNRRGDRVAPLEAACALAARIPGARLAVLDGDCYLPEGGDIAAVAGAIRAFAGVPGRPRLADGAPRPPEIPGPCGLSARELEVLRLVARGLTDAQVAARLALSPRTVGQHLRSIYNKLDLPSRSAATRFALEHDLA
jgi:DNA-binding CsgD family transcriptional regulator